MAAQNVAYTALRHGFYASTLEYYLPAAVQAGELRLPEDGPFSWTAHDDLAEVDVTDRTIKRIVVDDEEWKETVTAQGMPAEAADFTLGMFRAARAGQFAVTDPPWKPFWGGQQSRRTP